MITNYINKLESKSQWLYELYFKNQPHWIYQFCAIENKPIMQRTTETKWNLAIKREQDQSYCSESAGLKKVLPFLDKLYTFRTFSSHNSWYFGWEKKRGKKWGRSEVMTFSGRKEKKKKGGNNKEEMHQKIK